jgi:hypothetical protein
MWNECQVGKIVVDLLRNHISDWWIKNKKTPGGSIPGV